MTAKIKTEILVEAERVVQAFGENDEAQRYRAGNCVERKFPNSGTTALGMAKSGRFVSGAARPLRSGTEASNTGY